MAAGAVVAGSATGVLAAPSAPPWVHVAVDLSLQPWIYAGSAGGGDSSTLYFSARTVGSPTWDLLDEHPQPGPEAVDQIPVELSIGQAFEYQVADCDSTGCAASDVQTGYVSPALGAGERPGATRVPFTVGDRLAAQVDVGSGNLLLTATQLSLPRRSGAAIDIGLAYNSVTALPQAGFESVIAPGWRTSWRPPTSGWRTLVTAMRSTSTARTASPGCS